jgi:hypothetical protein
MRACVYLCVCVCEEERERREREIGHHICACCVCVFTGAELGDEEISEEDQKLKDTLAELVTAIVGTKDLSSADELVRVVLCAVGGGVSEAGREKEDGAHVHVCELSPCVYVCVNTGCAEERPGHARY